MLIVNRERRLSPIAYALFFLIACTSTVLADRVTLSYVDAESNAQTLQLDCDTPNQDLAFAASLVGEEGVSLAFEPGAGCGTLAELAGAMASAAPLYAARIARALSALSQNDAEAIVAAVNAVPGVNTNAVLAAVHFGPPGKNTGPQVIGSDSAISLDEIQSEQVSSSN